MKLFKVERDTHTNGKGDTEPNRQNVTEKVGGGCSNNLKKKLTWRYIQILIKYNTSSLEQDEC